jgi:hypothetical protein
VIAALDAELPSCPCRNSNLILATYLDSRYHATYPPEFYLAL